MSQNLLRAHFQWANRPDDERFWNLTEMLDAVKGIKNNSFEEEIPLHHVRAVADRGEIRLDAPRIDNSRFTYHAFEQFLARLGTGGRGVADYLRTLPCDLAVKCINENITKAVDGGTEYLQYLVTENPGDRVLRATTSTRYTRIWDADLVQSLLDLPDTWRTPPARPAGFDDPRARPATEADILPDPSGFVLSVNVGDLIAPAGLYWSPSSLFVFMVDETNRIDDGSEHGLARGFFIENSEIGKAAFKVTLFLYRHVCGNHIVWDASDVRHVSLRHVGQADMRAFRYLRNELDEYVNTSASQTENRIRDAQRMKLGNDREEVVEVLYNKRQSLGKGALPPSQKLLNSAFDLATDYAEIDGDPRTVWGMAQGITRYSQTLPYGDARVQADRMAGNVLALAA